MSKLLPISQPVVFQRIEGAVIFIAASGLYFGLRGSLVMYLIMLASIDLSMLGYLAGSRVGAAVYNLFHNYTGPVICITIGLLNFQTLWLAGFGLVWMAHIGGDRALGYGLKFGDGFKHTHLGWIGKRKKA